MLNTPSVLDRARLYEREQSVRVPAGDRPLFHLTPLVGWMNDPNGFCWYQGRYHLFYQYHPYSTSWGPMHWGHAVSTDLLRWVYEPCAIAPDTMADAGGCFSGSALTMPDGRMMLMYTGVQPAGIGQRERQAQCVAFGDGVNFVKAAGNPVVQLHGLDDAYSRIDFRDPKAWRDESGLYHMVAGCRHAEKAGTIVHFTSENALDWRFAGEIDASGHRYGEMWECPDFFALDGRQVLMVSPQQMHALEEFHAGYGTVALLGSWNGESGVFTREQVQPVDYGLDFYASQTVLTPDGRRVMIGWMDNWETCKEAPRDHAWYGSMSLPRELSIRNGRLYQQPIREIETLWKDEIRHERVQIHQKTSLSGISGRVIDLSVTLHPEGSTCRRFSVRVAEDEERFTLIRCDLARGELTFDRSHGGSLRDIAHTRHVLAEVKDGELKLRIILDKESVELFINDGERVLTSKLPTVLSAEGISFEADAPISADIDAPHLG